MKTYSISEAKNRLSAILELVRNGESVLILDRNQPVARLEPVAAASVAGGKARLNRLERNGVIRPAAEPIRKQWLRQGLPSTKNGASILRALLAERDEGR